MSPEDSSWIERLQAVDLPWVDQVGIVLAVLFLLLGIWRGLWWQVIRLLGVVGSVALARGLTPRFTPTVEGAFELTPRVAYGMVWFVVFLCGLVVASLLGLIGKRALEAMQLGLVDRLGGGLAGALTGLILHCAFLIVLTALGNSAWTQRTLAGTRSAVLLNNLSHKRYVLVDAEAAERIVGEWARGFNAAGGAKPQAPQRPPEAMPRVPAEKAPTNAPEESPERTDEESQSVR